MNLHRLVWKEMWQRPLSLATCVVAIVCAVATLVAIRHITVFSEREIGHKLQALGANILVLPKGATLQDYYSADQNGQSMPEEQVAQILMAGLTGVEQLSPRLTVSAETAGHPLTLVGILPQNELHAKQVWDSATLFQKKHVGCKSARCQPRDENAPPETLATDRTIAKLGPREAVAGADVASQLELKRGQSLRLLGETFKLVAVLPATGTADDSRVFAHLHTVQSLAKAGEVVSAIEVMACCDDAAGQLVPQLSALLPDSRVVTISQVVETQVGVNRLMVRCSWIVLAALTLVGSVSVASVISANVRERRREIGSLVALGATPVFISAMFLLKAAWLGIAGAVGGCLTGIALATSLGPHWTGVAVTPLVDLAAIAIGVTLVITMLAAYLPARQAAQLDPCACLREV